MARTYIGVGVVGAAAVLAACGGGGKPAQQRPSVQVSQRRPVSGSSTPASPGSTPPLRVAPGSSAATEPPGQFTMSFAGDVHFAERTAALLQRDPATAFGVTKDVLSRADLTMVNLETAVAVGGQPEAKSFTFEAPPSAFTALRDAGIDVATMANNHGADYGANGLSQTLAAIRSSGFPVVGIGANAAQAYAPLYRTVNGVRIAIIAASQVQDETLAHFSAGPDSAGIANAYSDQLLASVRAARAKADVVITYIHWGTEYQACPNADQQSLADRLAAAGVTAIIGTHAHVLQGAGWRPDGSYVAYGLGNYYWWRSFGNDQDDNGVLTLTFAHQRVTAAHFSPSRLDDQGISPPATGAVAQRIDAEWEQRRQQCTNLLPTPTR